MGKALSRRIVATDRLVFGTQRILPILLLTLFLPIFTIHFELLIQPKLTFVLSAPGPEVNVIKGWLT